MRRAFFIPVMAMSFLTAASSMRCAGQQTGSLQITVIDESGAAIPKADVRVDDLPIYSGVAGPYGVVEISGLSLGTHRLSAKHSGFRDAELSGVVVVGGRRNDVTIKMVQTPPNPSDVQAYETFDPDLYSKAFDEMKEPQLCQQGLSEHMHGYRFLWVPTFDHPVFMRVDIEADGTAILRVETWSGKGGYGWGKVQAGTTRKLSWDEQADLFATLADIGFWTLPSRIKDPYHIFLDGTEWLIEGVRDGRCHVVIRYGSPLTEIFSQYFLGNVAKVKPYYEKGH